VKSDDMLKKVQDLQAQYDREIAKRLMESQDRAMLRQTAPSPQTVQFDSQIVASGIGTYSSTGENWRDHGELVTDIHTKHGKGFWSIIQIYEDDHIFYKLFRTGFLRRILCGLGIRDPKDTSGGDITSWDQIAGQDKKDSKLEATLGKTYLKIDEKIAEELVDEEHRKFIRGIADTDPENLKMIAGLKTLDEGMTEPLSAPIENTSRPPPTPPMVTIKQPENVSQWNSNNTIAMGANEIIRVDPDDKISFAQKMEKAIKKVMDAPETGKTP
jgi:hypothetical protein